MAREKKPPKVPKVSEVWICERMLSADLSLESGEDYWQAEDEARIRCLSCGDYMADDCPGPVAYDRRK